MSLQWTLVAGFLYVEIGVVLILLLPFISASRWNSIFKSRLVSSVGAFSTIYFRASVCVLLLLFVDAFRSQHHYSPSADDASSGSSAADGPLTEMHNNMKLFRSQRNLYVAGFALFLVFVIRRLTALISEQAALKAGCEAALRQAQSAGEAAQRLIDGQGDMSPNQIDESNRLKERLEKVTGEKTETLSELENVKSELEAVKRKAEGTSEEYNRLLLEHTKLDKKLSVLGKKDD